MNENIVDFALCNYDACMIVASYSLNSKQPDPNQDFTRELLRSITVSSFPGKAETRANYENIWVYGGKCREVSPFSFETANFCTKQMEGSF